MADEKIAIRRDVPACWSGAGNLLLRSETVETGFIRIT